MGEEKSGQTGAKPPQKNKKEKVPELVGVSHQSEEDQALKEPQTPNPKPQSPNL